MTRDEKYNLIMHVFIQWLTKEDALDAWMCNVLSKLSDDNMCRVEHLSNENIDNLLWELCDEHCIDNSFTWDEYPEDSNFWSALNEQWYGMFNELEDKLDSGDHVL